MEPQEHKEPGPPFGADSAFFVEYREEGTGEQGSRPVWDRPVSCRVCHGEQNIAGNRDVFKGAQSIF